MRRGLSAGQPPHFIHKVSIGFSPEREPATALRGTACAKAAGAHAYLNNAVCLPSLLAKATGLIQ